MRIAWALVTFLFLLFFWGDVTAYWSEGGLLPSALVPLVARSELRFTVLTWITEPEAVFALYLLLLFSLLCAMIGVLPRFMTIASTLLLFSFHERDPLPLAGGDTVLRHLGFFLCLAPTLRAFSVTRIFEHWNSFRKTRRLLPPLTMAIWPLRLLLWQLVVIYITSTWYKLYGGVWRTGLAVASVLHHPVFARFPIRFMNWLTPLAPGMNYLLLLWQGSWALLLLPASARADFTHRFFAHVSLKRVILLFGLFFHGMIFILMDVGSFSLAIFAAYLGLLDASDFAAMREFFNRSWHGKIAVLYDGHCGLCQRSVFVLALLDNLHRLRLVDFQNPVEHHKFAPELSPAALDRTLHIKMPDGITAQGFFAFRMLARHLPALWIIVPFLYLPGASFIGQRIYARIAERRKTCTHEKCTLT